MSLRNYYQSFLKLPAFYKYIGVGSFILAVSTLMPWYSDLDSYRVGDVFLGISGPASFVGIVVLLISLLSFGIFLTHLFERRKIRLPVRESVFQLFVGVQTLFLLLLVNSIYFHPKFGVNILLKEVRFGMILAFLGAVLVTFGGYLQNKKEKNTEDLVGKLEPLVSMPEERKHSPIERKTSPSEQKREPMKQESFLKGEDEAGAPQPPPRSMPPRSASQPISTPPHAQPPRSTQSGSGEAHGGSYMWKPGK